jgi:NAD(P)-dependent dehydrogenase (short-subunit alcohol dehydrogenase family)
MQRLTGKVAVVTGSSWGIGGAIALRFAHEGADVVINYARSIAEAHDVRTQVEAAGQRGLVVQADLRSPRRQRGWSRRRPATSAGSTSWSITPAGVHLGPSPR